MKIAVTDQGFIFASFYVLSFAVSLIIVIVFCIRRNIPLRLVLLMMTTISLLTILGSRLSTVPVSQWPDIIKTGSFNGQNGRFALGGLIFGLAGLILARHLLGIDRSIIRLYSWLAPLGFGIQKLGCFFNGCCYGTPSGLPWSVQYPACTNVHFYQWTHGMIAGNEAWSLPVHPVQLYEAAGLFFVCFVAWRYRNLWKKSWSALLFTLLLVCLIRFTTEFFRDPSATYTGSNYLMGIKMLQWFLILSAAVLVMLLLISQKSARTITESSIAPSPGMTAAYLLIVSAAIFSFRGLFTKFELVSLDLKFIPAVFLTGIFVFRSLSTIRVRIATASFLTLPLFIVTLAFPQDTVRQNQPVESIFKGPVSSFNRIDFGYSFGSYYGTVKYNPHEGFCGTVYTEEDYKYSFRLAGLGISRIKYDDKTSFTYGINMFAGREKEVNYTNWGDRTYTLYGVSPYFKYDMSWVGIGAGLSAGNLRWIPVYHMDKPDFEGGTRYSSVFPGAYLRIGRRDVADFRYIYGLNFPSSYPALVHDLSVGSGFGSIDKFNLRLGVDIGNAPGFYFSAEALPVKQFGFNLRYDFGKKQLYESEKFFSWFSVNANYRFGYRK